MNSQHQNIIIITIIVIITVIINNPSVITICKYRRFATKTLIDLEIEMLLLALLHTMCEDHASVYGQDKVDGAE